MRKLSQASSTCLRRLSRSPRKASITRGSALASHSASVMASTPSAHRSLFGRASDGPRREPGRRDKPEAASDRESDHPGDHREDHGDDNPLPASPFGTATE